MQSNYLFVFFMYVLNVSQKIRMIVELVVDILTSFVALIDF